jgi:hypothetical protein
LGFRRWLVQWMIDYLTRPLPSYERRGHNDLRALKAHARKGDVILVEGDQRVSAIIRYLTQSSWSHSALYVGDELTARGGELAAFAHDRFGPEASHLLVEALPEGVVASPLIKYVDFNVRICRPHGLRPSHLRQIMDEAMASIGWRYDLRNAFDLARYLIPVSLVPNRWRSTALHFGSGEPTEVMCSSLIARLFQRVRFPVLPTLTFPQGESPPRPHRGRLARRIFGEPSEAFTGIFRMRHPKLVTPRDFDLSPYFDIIKFNHLAEGDFDYSRMRWAEDAEVASRPSRGNGGTSG